MFAGGLGEAPAIFSGEEVHTPAVTPYGVEREVRERHFEEELEPEEYGEEDTES